MSSVHKCIILLRINNKLFYIRESEVYLSTGELLYNAMAVYIITVLIKTSVKFESHYNLLAVSCYFDHYFSASFTI